MYPKTFDLGTFTFGLPYGCGFPHVELNLIPENATWEKKESKICGRELAAIVKNLLDPGNLFRYHINYDARRVVHYAKRYLTSACLPVNIIIYLHLFCVVDLNDGLD